MKTCRNLQRAMLIIGSPPNADAPPPLSAAAARASAALAPQHVAKARSLAAAQASALGRQLSCAGGRDAAVSCRSASPAELALGASFEASADAELASELEAAICARIGLLHMGAALLQVGESRGRERELVEAAHALGAAAHSLGPPAASGAPPERASASEAADGYGEGRGGVAGLFERQAFTMWSHAVSLLRENGVDGEAMARDVHELGVQRGVWTLAMQRPLELLDKSLARRNFWDASSLPAAVALEASHDAILEELRALMRAEAGSDAADGGEGVEPEADRPFAEYRSRVVSSGGRWSDFQLFASCRKDADHCQRCPRTADAIAS